MSVTIYHNPRCSKSRQTLELIMNKNIEPVIIEYLNSPPDTDELKRILKILNMKPRDLMRNKEPVYKAKGLDDKSLTDDQLIQAMIENPILIERPIVVADGRAILGRPPENVLEII